MAELEQRVRLIQRFLRYLFGAFIRDRCPEVAGVLSYTSLLSLVPLMAVSFAVFAAFPVFDDVTGKVQDFIFSNFVPAAGEVVEAHLQGFVAKASRLTAPGIVFLVVTALLLMSTIDRALNTIWKVRVRRRLLHAFMVYWAVLTLGPLLIGVSLVVTSYVVSLPLLTDAASSLGGAGFLLKLMPFLAGALAFTLLYAVVPNQGVPFRHALAGGAVAALLFELAKKAFALYVTHFPTYEAIYGALAAMPIFLVWIYLSWLVILLGAEFTHCLGTFQRGPVSHSGRGGDLVMAYRIVGHLWRAQLQGVVLSEADLEELESGPALERVLGDLLLARIIHRVEEGGWALSRDVHELTLAELYHSGRYVLPGREGEWVSVDAWNRSLHGVLADVSQHLEQRLSIPLADLYREEGAAASS